jgi:hypothetical protein
LRHAFITAALDAGAPSATSRKPHPTLTRAPPCATTAPGPASTATPLTSSPPTSPEPRGNSWGRPGRRPRLGRLWPYALPARLPGVAAGNDHEPPSGRCQSAQDFLAEACRIGRSGARVMTARAWPGRVPPDGPDGGGARCRGFPGDGAGTSRPS